MDRRQLTVRTVALSTTAVLALVACTDRRRHPPPAALGASGPVSDLSGLAQYGVDVGTGVLIDIAGDGRERFLQARADGIADFGGTGRSDATLMVLRPAATRATDRVVINAPRWNPELGGGYCVAQATVPALVVVPCRPGDPVQIWHVVPAGDSGQFRLDGRRGTGHQGLQTVPFTG